MACEEERLVSLFRCRGDVGAADAPPAGRDHLGQRLAEVVAFVPKRGVGTHDVVDGMDHLLRGRKRRGAREVPLMQIEETRRIEMLVVPREHQECVVVQMAE